MKSCDECSSLAGKSNNCRRVPCISIWIGTLELVLTTPSKVNAWIYFFSTDLSVKPAIPVRISHWCGDAAKGRLVIDIRAQTVSGGK